MTRATEKRAGGSWYEKYLPFVARSTEMQLRWLEAALKKGTLSPQELTPYIKLLMADETEEHADVLRALFAGVVPATVEALLNAADIHDCPALFGFIPEPSVRQALIAIDKAPPPYEKNPQIPVDRLFQAVYDRSENLLAEAATQLLGSDRCPVHFQAAYDRFKEIKEDEKLLSALYPKALV